MKSAMTIFTPKFSNLQYLNYFYIYGFIRDKFKQPENIDTLKNLTKLTTLKLVLEPSMHQYNHQGPLSSSVTKLDVGIKGKTSRDDMDIGWIFAMFPSINDLEIWWSGARLIGYERSQPTICPNLTKLNLGKVVTHPNLLKFICDCAPNLKDLYWKILAKKEKNDQIHHSEIQVEEPDTKKGVAYYHIDLTGFSLDCFHLIIDLRENPKDKCEDVYLSLKQKHGIKYEFITLKEYSLILPKNHNLFPKSKSPVKAKIRIKNDFTKKIDINSNLVLDLEKSKIMSPFSYW